MTDYRQIILDGLKDLELIQKGKYTQKKIENFTISENSLKQLQEIENYSKNNVTIIDSFPNALLLDESIFVNPKKKVDVDKNLSTDIDNQKTDIWDILDQIQTDNHSENLDTISSENPNEQKKICIACKSNGTLFEDHRTSSLICSNCGVVNEGLFDQGPEWRQYNNEDNRSDGVNRCGCPTNFFFPKSSQGTIMVGTTNRRLRRKQRWLSMVYKERSLNQVHEYIMQICIKNNIPKIIIDDARIFYKKISDCKHKEGDNAGKQIIIRGANRLSIIAACVFYACEKNKIPRSIKEIADMFDLDEKKVTKGNKQFDRIIKNIDDKTVFCDQENETAENYIRRHCPKLNISKTKTEIAVKIARNCCKMKLASDHNPQSIAAGSILVMVHYFNLKIEKREISKLFGTSDVTIGKIYNKICYYVEALIDDNATDYLIKKFKING